MKSKKYLPFFLFYLISFTSFSQEKNTSSKKQKSEFWKKVRYGGGLGLDFSNNGTSINISPSAIYQINPKFSTGAGVNFGYSSFRANDAKQFNYGVSLISLYNPFDGLQLSGELEHTFVNQSFRINDVKSSRDFNFPAFYIGAGYSIGNFTAGLRYDLLYNEDKSIFSSALNPFVRFYL